MDGAGSRRADADAELAGMFGESRSHERRGFLVTHPDILMRSWRLRSASMIELMPSPTTPKQWVAPHEIRVSIMISAVVKSGANCGEGWTVTTPKVSELAGALRIGGARRGGAPADAGGSQPRRPSSGESLAGRDLMSWGPSNGSLRLLWSEANAALSGRFHHHGRLSACAGVSLTCGCALPCGRASPDLDGLIPAAWDSSGWPGRALYLPITEPLRYDVR